MAIADNYIARKKGILKTMSKMGFRRFAATAAAQLFRAIGLGREVVDKYFTGVSSRIEASVSNRLPATRSGGMTAPGSFASDRPDGPDSAASITIARKANTTCGTRRPSAGFSTPSSTTMRRPMRNFQGRSTSRPAGSVRCGGSSSLFPASRSRRRRWSRPRRSSNASVRGR